MRWLVVLALASCAVDESVDTEAVTTCATSGYTPYVGHEASGTIDELPWPGEDFSSYPLPSTVECSYDKGRVASLDVTDGCLDAVQVGAYQRGRVRATVDGYFRAIALGHTADDPDHAVKWTDQGIEYRFFYRARTGDAGNPGFKAFARYRTEDDLYVASWRADGVVQIQQKRCGTYTALAVRRDLGPPSPGVWHTIQFVAVGDELELSLDHVLVLTATSGTFSWGTVGIRIDGMDGAYIDDWRAGD